jgi:hypothetical protein
VEWRNALPLSCPTPAGAFVPNEDAQQHGRECEFAEREDIELRVINPLEQRPNGDQDASDGKTHRQEVCTRHRSLPFAHRIETRTLIAHVSDECGLRFKNGLTPAVFGSKVFRIPDPARRLVLDG